MEFVKLETNESIATLTINKPKAMNALSSQVLKDLNTALDQLESDKNLRCVIVTGEGDKAFVAGADIKEISELDEAQALEFAKLGQGVFSRIENFRVPFIAAVNGFALGGGLELAMACDFIVASTNAKVGLPESTLGLMPGFGGSVRLARKIGPGQAKQMTYTGDMVDANQALQFGLVNEVVEQSDLIEHVGKIAGRIAKRAPLAITAIKHTVEATYGVASDQAMEMERKEFAKLCGTQDVKEGTTAFIEKRKPSFQGL